MIINQIAHQQERLLNVIDAHLNGGKRVLPKVYREAMLLAEYLDLCLAFLEEHPSVEPVDNPLIGQCVKCHFHARMGRQGMDDYVSHVCVSSN